MPGEFQQQAGHLLAGLGAQGELARQPPAGQRGLARHFPPRLGGYHDREVAVGGDGLGRGGEQLAEGERVVVPGHGAPPVGAVRAVVHVEGRIADDGVEGLGEVLRLYPPAPRVHPFGEGAGRHVLGGLPAGLLVHLHARHAGLREALRHHQGDEPRAGAHVQYAPPAPGPGSQQHAVRAHFHGAAVVAHHESLELEFPFSHLL